MRISIVTTLYHSAPYLREFHERITQSVQRLTDDYELVLVNDGSPDESLELSLGLQTQNSHLRIIDLSRNFGHHPAILTGLQHAQGDWVFLIDCDLEEDPELIESFFELQRQSGADMVYGVQNTRNGGIRQRLSGWVYYKVFNLLSTVPIPQNMMTVRLMSRRFVDSLLTHREVEFVLSGLWSRTGYKQLPVPVEKKDKGKSSYTLAHKIAVLVNSITSFSAKPLYYIFYFGLFISMIAGLGLMVIIIDALFSRTLQAGWPSLMVSIWFLGGVIVFCQGVVGVYLSKVFMETKRRPLTLIAQIYEGGADATARSGQGSFAGEEKAVSAMLKKTNAVGINELARQA
jgi:putative glycosyltransferase